MPRYEDTPLSADYEDILRRRKIADALSQRSFMPAGSEMVSGRVIPNWGRGMSNIGRAAMSDYTNKKTDEKERQLSGRYDTESAASMQKIMDTLQGGGGATPNPRKAAMDATVDPYLRGNVSSQRVIDAMIRAEGLKGRGSSSRSRPIGTNEGYLQEDAQGNWVPITNQSGKPYLPWRSDEELVSDIAGGVEGARQVQKTIYEPPRAGETKYRTDIAAREAEKVTTKPQIDSGLASVKAKTGMLDESIDKAIDQSGAFTAGFLGSATSWAPGTPAYDLGNTLNTIKANIGFDKLREMRDNSPTGGALGQVSELENKLLQQVWSSLEQGQSPSQLKENLEKVRKQTKESWDRVKAAYKKDYGVEYGEESATGAESTEDFMKSLDAELGL